MTGIPETIDNVPPVEIKDLPEEARRALEALRTGKTDDTVFVLKSELTHEQKQRRVLLAKVCTAVVLLFGLGLGGLVAATQSFWAGIGILALFLFNTLMLWFFWVIEAQALVENPWHESMICTPNHLLVSTMGMIRSLSLADWEGVAILTRSRRFIRLNAASRQLDLGSIGDTGKETVERFCTRLHQRIQGHPSR